VERRDLHRVAKIVLFFGAPAVAGKRRDEWFKTMALLLAIFNIGTVFLGTFFPP
jgi:hypothetical protein